MKQGLRTLLASRKESIRKEIFSYFARTDRLI